MDFPVFHWQEPQPRNREGPTSAKAPRGGPSPREECTPEEEPPAVAAPPEYSSGSGPSARAQFLGVRLSAGRIGQTLVFFIFNIQKRSLLSASLTEIVQTGGQGSRSRLRSGVRSGTFRAVLSSSVPWNFLQQRKCSTPALSSTVNRSPRAAPEGLRCRATEGCNFNLALHGRRRLLLLLSRFSRVRLCATPQTAQPTRLPRPWDSPSKNTGVGCQRATTGC